MSEHPVRRLIQGGQKYLLILTFAEVFGGPRPSLEDFRRRLSVLPRLPLVRVCAILNAFLRSDASSSELLNFASHRALIRAYFPTKVAQKIRTVTEGSNPRIVFHRQQLLFTAKEALLYASENTDLSMPNTALGEIFLIANDLMHFEADDGSHETLDSFAKLASTILPIQEASNGNVRHKILRSYQMTKLAPELFGTKPYFDLPVLFKQAAGLDLMEFYAFIISAITRFYRFDPEKFLADPRVYSLDEQWFARTKVAPDAIQAFFSLVSAPPAEYQQSLQSSRGPNDFTSFRDKPLLRASSKLDLMDLWMLAEKFESGPFWLIHANLPANHKPLFHSFWGRLFERYIADLLAAAANPDINRVYVAPAFAKTDEELSDTVVICDRNAVLIEAKGTTFTARAKYEGDYKLLKQELESKLVESTDREQAVVQLARNIERAFGRDRLSVEGIDLQSITTVFPVVITRDDLGGVAGVNGFLGERFDQILKRKELSVAVTPLTCISSEHAEALSAYLSDTRLTDLLVAHIRANRKGAARYLTMPFFSTPNAVLSKKGQRPIPNQLGNFDELIQCCVRELGLNATDEKEPDAEMET